MSITKSVNIDNQLNKHVQNLTDLFGCTESQIIEAALYQFVTQPQEQLQNNLASWLFYLVKSGIQIGDGLEEQLLSNKDLNRYNYEI